MNPFDAEHPTTPIYEQMTTGLANSISNGNPIRKADTPEPQEKGEPTKPVKPKKNK